MGCSASHSNDTSAFSQKPDDGSTFYPSAKYAKPADLGYEMDFCYHNGLFKLFRGTSSHSEEELCFKRYPPNTMTASEVTREITILTELSQYCDFPKYMGLFVHMGSPHIVTAAHHPTSLNSIAHKLSPYEKRKVLKSLLSAVHYCHKHSIVICNLGPDSIKLSSSGEHLSRKVPEMARSFTIQIVDFSCAVRTYEKTTLGQLRERAVWSYFCNTCGPFIAPELVTGHVDGVVTSKADVWSVGMVIELIMREAIPLPATSEETANVDHIYVRLAESIEQRIPEGKDYRKLVTKMLEMQPSQRCDLSFVQSHPSLRSSSQNIFADTFNSNSSLHSRA